MAIIALFFSVTVQAQSQRPEASKFDQFIKQVYVNQGASQITPKTRKYSFMKTFFNELIQYVTYDPAKLQLLNYTKLSQIELFNDYNKGLPRDASFNPATFNPFKYKLDFYSNKVQFIHVDNTNYVIVIQPQS